MAKLMLGTREVTPAIFTGGTTPAGTLSITQNGTYNVTNYASANVNVSSGYTEIPSYQVDANGVVTRRSIVLAGTEFSNITEIGDYSMMGAFWNCDEMDGALDLSALTSIGNYGMYETFSGCTGLTGALDLSALTSIGNYGMYETFSGCTGLTGALDLSALTSIGNYGMQGAFGFCFGLTDIYFWALTETSFGAHTNQFEDMLLDCFGVTLHFPENLESTIAQLTGYPEFGGDNIDCAFDLPATP